jgi:hypothetical protein
VNTEKWDKNKIVGIIFDLRFNMKKTYNIPKPCSENWNNMTPDAKGRLCSSCEKVVIDFTSFSSKEIISYLKANPRACGRFSKNQFVGINQYHDRSKFSIPKFTGLFTITAFLGITTPVIAYSSQPKIEYQKDSSWKSILPNKQLANDSITISGTVLDENDLPLPSANIILKGTAVGTTTDFDGNFELTISKIKLKSLSTLVLTYTGYETMEIQIDTQTTKVKAKLVVDNILMGEVVRYNIFQRTGNFFKRLFRKK